MYIATLAKEKWYAQHPLKSLAPAAKSLMVTSLGDGHHFLAVFNPDDAVLKRPETISLLSDLLSMAAMQLSGEGNVAASSRASARRPARSVSKVEPGFSEEAPRASEADEMIDFLDNTLLRRRNLGVRNSVGYVTLRSWRKQTKEVQMAAMFAIKRNPSALAVARISAEIAVMAGELNGPAAYDAVVPVPCGSSGTELCLSVRIAKELALQLGIPFVNCLKGQLGRGKSHPKKNIQLEPFIVKEPAPKRVLLVDDVVTSGKHIELSVTALRESGANVTAIAWIGPTRAPN